MNEEAKDHVQVQRGDTWVSMEPGDVRRELYDIINQRKLSGQSSGQITLEGQTYKWSVEPDSSSKQPVSQ